MRKGAGGGVDERAIGAGLRHRAALHVLIRLDGKEHVADIFEVHACVVRAKNKDGSVVRRITLGCGQTDVRTFGEKNVIHVVVAGAVRTGGDVHELQDVGLGQRGGQGLFDIGGSAHGVAIVGGGVSVLVGDVNEVAQGEMREEGRRSSPASG